MIYSYLPYVEIKELEAVDIVFAKAAAMGVEVRLLKVSEVETVEELVADPKAVDDRESPGVASRGASLC